VGQYTKFIGCEGESEYEGRLLFVGEHTSSDWIGFMEGAIETGTKAALAITGSTRSNVQKSQASISSERRSWKRKV
jgi:monoamine oxidase